MSVRGFERVRKSISKSVKGKHACKFRFTITYEYVDLRCNNRWQPTCLSIVWFRSHRSKVSEKPSSKVSITDDKTGIVSYAANWFPPNSVDLVVTLYKDFTGLMFKKKEYMFVIENVTQDARKKLAIFPCNMAEYASPDTQVFDLEMEFKPLSKKISTARLGAKVKCEFIKQGNSEEDDMQSNFSHLSDADFKLRLSELVECSDDEDEEDDESENKQNDRDRIAERSRHTWSQFIDEMKTLEYKNVAMLENPIADTLVDVDSGGNDGQEQNSSVEPEETEAAQPETKSSKLLERNRERRKVVSVALEDLTECLEEEEEEEDLSIISPSSLSSTSFSSSLRSKFTFPLTTRKTRSESLPPDPSKGKEPLPSESKQSRVEEWLLNASEDGQAQVRVEQLEKDNINLRATNSKLVLKVADLEKEKAELHSEVDEMQWLVKFKKSDFVKERDELQAEITELQMLVEDLRTKLQQAEEKLEKSVEKKNISSSIEGGMLNVKQNEICQVRGWLCKRGVKGLTKKKWRRRWFSTDRDGRLYYYQKNNNTMPRGFIDLDVIIAVQDKPSSQQDINKACFNVITPTRTYELMAHDEEEKLRWINALDCLRHWRSRMGSSSERP